MNKTMLYISLMLAVFLTVCLASCGKKTSTADSLAFIMPEGEHRPLAVVFSSPNGELKYPDQSDSINITFNKPMAPLGAENAIVPHVTITPASLGTWSWKGTATLSFKPKAPLMMGTEYTVTVPREATSLDGEQLAKPFTFKFTTARLELKASFPVSQEQDVSLDSPLFLVFTQPVSLNKTKDFVSLMLGEELCNVTLRSVTDQEYKTIVKNSDEEDEDNPSFTQECVVALVPNAPLQWNGKYKIFIKKGLTGKSPSKLGTAKDITVDFTSLDKLKFTGINLEKNGLFNPSNTLYLNFTNSVPFEKVVRAISFEPKVDIPKSYFSDTDSDTNYGLNLALKANTQYKLTINNNFTDIYNNKLEEPCTYTFKTQNYDPEFIMPENYGIMESKLGGKLPLTTLNVKEFSLQLAGLSKDQVVQLLSSDEPLSKYYPKDGYAVEKKVKIPNFVANQDIFSNIDIKDALNSQKTGLVYYQANPLEALDSNLPLKSKLSGFVQVTNLGLTCKYSQENILVWCTSLSQGKGLEGVTIEIRGQDNKNLYTGTTDKNGLLTAPGLESLKLRSSDNIYQYPKLFIIASLGQDISVISSQADTKVDNWRLTDYVDYNASGKSFLGSVFTERGLYKPGEQVHFKSTVRQLTSEKLQVPTLKKLHYKINDGNGTLVDAGDLNVNSFGSVNGTLKLSSDASVGTYDLEVSIPEKEAKKLKTDSYIDSTNFMVKEYKPAQFDVKTKTDVERAAVGDKVTASFTGRYLFGAPMSGDNYKFTARTEDSYYSSNSYPDFSFGQLFVKDGEKNPVEQTIVSSSGKLDDKGFGTLSVDTKSVNIDTPCRLITEATVSSPAKEEFSSSSFVDLWPSSVNLGLKHTSFVVKQGQDAKFKLICLNMEDKPVDGVKTKLQFIKVDWSCVRKAGASGLYEWVSETNETVENTQELKTGAEPLEFSFAPKNSGFYIVRAEALDSKGRKTLCDTSIYVSGSGYAAWERRDSDIIELVTDKKEYKAGEVATVLIKSPYEKAKALITVESSAVIDRKIVDITGTCQTVEIPVKASYKPNVFVSAVLITGRGAKNEFSQDGFDLSKPSFKIGCCMLNVDYKDRELKVDILPDKKDYVPGELVKVDLYLKDKNGNPTPGEICLAVVDEGVLKLIDYKTPEYLSKFYGQRCLKVFTLESRLEVLGQRNFGSKGANPGGGGGLDASLMGEYRRDFASTCYWAPSLKTDSNGHVEASFNLPQSTTAYRIMAVCQTKDSRFASGQTEITASKPILMQPSMPGFVRVGDHFQAGVLLSNNTKEPQNIKVSAKSTKLSISADSFTVKLAPGEDKQVIFDFTASQRGNSEIGFTATAGCLKDSLAVTVPVEAERVTEVVAVSGDLKNGDTSETIKVPGSAMPGSAYLEASVFATDIGTVDGAYDYLVSDNYQQFANTLMRLSARLSLYGFSGNYQKQGCDKKQLKKDIIADIKEIGKYYRGDGRFATSPDETDISSPTPFVTASALTVLWDAKDLGFKVQKSILDDSYLSLKTVLQKGSKQIFSGSTYYNNYLKAVIFHALARAGSKDKATLSLLFESRDKMDLAARVHLLWAASFMKNSQVVNVLRDDMQNRLKVQPQTAWFELSKAEKQDAAIYTSTETVTALALDAMLKTGDFPLAPRVVRWLTEARVQGHWGRDDTDLFALRAIVHYCSKYATTEDNLKTRVRVGGNKVLEANISSKIPCASGKLNLDSIGENVKVDLEAKGIGKINYDLRLWYAPLTDPPARDRGFSVFTQYTDMLGKPVQDTFKCGELYKQTVSVIIPSDRRYVMLDIPVASGMAVMQTDFASVSQTYRKIINSANNKSGLFNTFDSVQTLSDKIMLFANAMCAGEYTYTVLVKAIYSGHYRQPAIRVQQQFHPEVYGTTKASVVDIKK